jgi:hypothetical protein
MSIAGKIQLVINQILVERGTTGTSDTAHKVRDKAVAAIIAGQRTAAGDITPEWWEYMNYLLTATDPQTPADPAELARLLPTDGTTDADRQKERAYAAANGMCGSTTTDTLLDGNVTATLDTP